MTGGGNYNNLNIIKYRMHNLKLCFVSHAGLLAVHILLSLISISVD